MIKDSFIVNGNSDVTFKSGDGSGTSTREFDNGFLGYLSQYISGGEFLDTTVTLTGSDWTVSTMRFGADGGNHVTINDANNNEGRRIDFLKLGESSDVNLISTRVKYIEGGEGGTHNVNLGSASTRSVNLFGDQNNITTGSGYVANIEVTNNSNVKVNGDVGSFYGYQSNDKLTVNSGWIEFAKIRDGNDTVVVKSGSGIGTLKANANDGEVNTNMVTVKDGAQIQFFNASRGDSTIKMEGEGRINVIDTFMGSNDITTKDRFISSISTWESENTINIGSGGVGSIALGSESQLSHDITLKGWFGQIQIWESDSANITTGAEGGGTIMTRGGDDTITTGKGLVEMVLTGEGNDVVNVGTGSIGTLGTWEGNDKIKVSEMEGRHLWVNGDQGTDTLDFSKFSVKVTFSLDLDGQYQNVAKAGDFENNTVGHFSQTGIENLTGGKKNDKLTGDDNANKLVGKGGADTLAGGKGKDKLQGDAGDDIFVFGKKGGVDTVLDYEDNDTLRIEGHKGGFDTLVFSNKNGDRKIEYDGGTILLDGQKGLKLTEGDFDFV